MPPGELSRGVGGGERGRSSQGAARGAPSGSRSWAPFPPPLGAQAVSPGPHSGRSPWVSNQGPHRARRWRPRSHRLPSHDSLSPCSPMLASPPSEFFAKDSEEAAWPSPHPLLPLTESETESSERRAVTRAGPVLVPTAPRSARSPLGGGHFLREDSRARAQAARSPRAPRARPVLLCVLGTCPRRQLFHLMVASKPGQHGTQFSCPPRTGRLDPAQVLRCHQGRQRTEAGHGGGGRPLLTPPTLKSDHPN